MKTCTFFGHRDVYEPIENILRSTIIDLIANKNVIQFYVGNQGNVDGMVFRILKDLKLIYPTINYNVILAYMPKEKTGYDNCDILPEGIEKVPPRFAISWRNKWMIEKSDYVITYVTHSWSGAAKFKEIAEKKNRVVINITRKKK